VRRDAVNLCDGESGIGFGDINLGALNLSLSGDLVEAAANLYRMLIILDDMGASIIAVAPIPNVGIGLAINDRLKRAAYD
jgi:L-threonylcarbamoyladenylate synthase